MRFIRTVVCLLSFFSLQTGLQGAALARTGSLEAISRQLSHAESDIKASNPSRDRRLDDNGREALRIRVEAAQVAADGAIAQLKDRLAAVDVRIRELGPAPVGALEAPEIRRRRSALLHERWVLDSLLKRAKLLSLDARQLHSEIVRTEEEQFSQSLSKRSPSPLSPAFWAAIGHAFPRDITRITMFDAARARQTGLALERGIPWPALGGLALALLMLGPGQLGARRLGRRLLTEGTPGRRVRRSANALLRVLVGTLVPLLASMTLVQGAVWADLLPPSWEDLAGALLVASTFAGLTVSVLDALLMRSQPSWRIASISDDTASRLGPFSLILGGLAFVEILLTSFNRAVGASAAAVAASQALIALLHLMLIGVTLLTLGRHRAARGGEPGAACEPAHAGSAAGVLIAWTLSGAALLALLLGYISLSLLLVQMVAWSAVLGAGTYLLMMAIDDVTTTMFDRSSPVGVALVRGLGVRGSLVDQSGVLLSGILRVVIGVVALGLLLSPFGGGDGIDAVFGRLGALAGGFEVGGVAVSPGTILRGVVVLLTGLAIARMFARWLDSRYLPATDLDGSGRNSVSLVTRYVGVALASIWALASLGVGVEKIAILLSALSVGIGFGLQAITQNFVSGLVLLAERPIRIGDIVRIGTDEGDVRRISVRSTEIELADHSTLIVPNSELITKSVLNRTMANALGRVQIQFSAPIGTDAHRVHTIVLESLEGEGAILADPAPSVFIDSIADGRILFNGFAHVADPRAVYAARSNVFMTLLGRLREEGIEIGTMPQQLQLMGSPASAPSGEHDPRAEVE